MKNILLVDDENSLIMSMADGLESCEDQFRVYTASNGREAVETLETKPVDLVVTDLRMPEMDGFELLAYINDNRPSTPTIVMSAFATPRIEDKLKELGALQVLSKPLDFEKLAQAINQGLTHVFQGGSLAGISVGSFLQLMEAEQKTSLLEVLSEDRQKGFFYLDEGRLHDAVCGDKQGEQAAIEMLTWKGAQIRFRSLPEKKLKKNIHQTLMSLLMEASHLEDERAGESAGPETAASNVQKEMSLGGAGPTDQEDSVLSDDLDAKEELGDEDIVSGDLAADDVEWLVEDLSPEKQKSTVQKMPGAQENKIFDDSDIQVAEKLAADEALTKNLEEDLEEDLENGIPGTDKEDTFVPTDPSYEDNGDLFDVDEIAAKNKTSGSDEFSEDEGDLFGAGSADEEEGDLFGSNKTAEDEETVQEDEAQKEDALPEEPEKSAPGKITDEQVDNLCQVLKRMADEIEGVRVCAVAGMDGIGLAEHNPRGVDTKAFGGKFAMVMQLMDKSVQDLNIGEFQENLVQTKKAWILTHFLTPKYYLFIAVGRDSTVGNMRMVTGKYAKELAEIVK